VQSNRTTLVPSLSQEENFIYEPSIEGKLLRIERSARRPYGVVLREYMATQSPLEQAFNRSNIIPAERTTTTYSYEKGQTSDISTTTAEPQGAILPTEDWTYGNPTFLVTASAEKQSWEELYPSEWQYKKLTYAAAAREYPEVIEAMPPESPTQPSWASCWLASKQSPPTPAKPSHPRPIAASRRSR
jgi:hypothetical protein